MTDPIEIRLDRLLFPRPVPAGCDWAVIGLWVTHQRKTSSPIDPPITVRPEGDYYRIVDGRHRTIAGHLAGRDAIAAIVQPDDQ
ncbi:ParB/RepB/Spo0J family partition protein [Paractinoplanes maris]|uniref:ParB/RepB/Spo0J family partition protein n=1 Tax=Paractinoplanes maris TaxID=1734446 RepID=UPI002021394A|nr:ParB/RepB/Spo0J family partition protein [Actinoplanes maris]